MREYGLVSSVNGFGTFSRSTLTSECHDALHKLSILLFASVTQRGIALLDLSTLEFISLCLGVCTIYISMLEFVFGGSDFY